LAASSRAEKYCVVCWPLPTVLSVRGVRPKDEPTDFRKGLEPGVFAVKTSWADWGRCDLIALVSKAHCRPIGNTPVPRVVAA
jgi:hypothetical protein